MVECAGTHHKGCACHEARRDAEVARLRAELSSAQEAPSARWVQGRIGFPLRWTTRTVDYLVIGTVTLGWVEPSWRKWEYWLIQSRRYGTANTRGEAMAALAQACGVEVEHGAV